MAHQDIPKGKGKTDGGLDALEGEGKGKWKEGYKGYQTKGYGKDKGKGKGKGKGYGKGKRSMSSVDGGQFATISEHDIDWEYEGQWASGQQDDWGFSPMSKGQEASAPWNTGPDPS